ncbi:hypothetical protein [Kingella oralis]|jgi:hypothetical protein|uniref:Uncharacterized protein n=1 Tax=Kingella oralis ATCC 51147 TaxID=629741 RepID=C4GIN0_9NEIS|nr:hypothetical protein [Kingella oralis]EEP67652.1 hypothetical protein GCWU000324_01901 [Kingella oralis ATCC 51147]QMT43482.1 hypothetical protein H3L93_03850 [Kingella oralis]
MNKTKALAFLCRHQPLSDSVRYWVRQAAMAFADASLVAGLMVSLRSADGDISECARAALALCLR